VTGISAPLLPPRIIPQKPLCNVPKRKQKEQSLVDELGTCNARIAQLEARIGHAKLMGYADKVNELKRRLERAERIREKIRKKLHSS